MRPNRLVLAFLLASVAWLTAGCVSHPVEQTEAMLISAGFKVVQASTPAQQRHLGTLTSYKVSAVQWSGRVCYVYPEQSKNRLFVGNKSQYQAYLNMVQEQRAIRETSVDDKVNASSGAEGPGWGEVWGDPSMLE